MTADVIRAAAALADPLDDTRSTAVFDGIDPERVIGLLQANKVPLVEISGGELARSHVWREALAREERMRDELAAEFAEVAQGLASRGITPVLFKSAGGLPYRSSNVDLLVRPEEISRAAELFEELGHLRFPHYREDHKILFRRFHQGRSVICLHLHDAVSWGRIMILPGDEVVERARQPRTAERGFLVASSEDLLLVTLAHSLYETDQIRLSDLRALRVCTADAALDWPRVTQRVERQGWLVGFSSILMVISSLEKHIFGATTVPERVRDEAGATLEGSRWARVYVDRMMRRAEDGDPPLPYLLSRVWSKVHAVLLMMSRSGRSTGERLADLLSTAWNLFTNRLKLRCRPPVLVSLTGLDGSGKSSAIRVLHEAMTLCEIPTRVVWSRGGFTMPLQAAKRVARSMLGSRLPGPAETEQKRRWLSGPFAGTVFAALVVAEQSLHYLLRVRMPRLLGRSILCDRFAYDTVADLEAKLDGGRGVVRLAGALVRGLAPRPDLAILLRLAPEAAERRKPGDAPLPLLMEQAGILDRMAATHGLRVIDAARPDDEVIGEVVDLVLRCTFARFSRERA